MVLFVPFGRLGRGGLLSRLSAPQMARNPKNATSSSPEEHGLAFLNDEWNGSIANGQPFTLGWNRSLGGENAQLTMFRVTFPVDGLVRYEFDRNLTGEPPSLACQTFKLNTLPRRVDDRHIISLDPSSLGKYSIRHLADHRR